MEKRTKLLVALLLIGLGAAGRLLPHLWNFSPIAAVALFSGYYFGRRFAFATTVLAMLVGDFFIGFYEWQTMLVVYACFILIGFLGAAAKKHESWEVVLGSSLFGSVLFFAATNWAVWQFGGWYEKSLSGLFACYYFALPFFRGTLLGDLFYTAVFFGAYQAVCCLSLKKKKALASLN